MNTIFFNEARIIRMRMFDGTTATHLDFGIIVILPLNLKKVKSNSIEITKLEEIFEVLNSN